jgi:hypothetical protein
MSRRYILADCRGTSYAEVLIALAIVPIALLGGMGAFHASRLTIAQNAMASRALAMAESRIEAKRAARWDLLLLDDLDHDGRPDIAMRDDGTGGDSSSGDGMYSASWEHERVYLTWTVALHDPRGLATSGYVVLEARASYESTGRRREVKVATLRANPLYVGP